MAKMYRVAGFLPVFCGALLAAPPTAAAAEQDRQFPKTVTDFQACRAIATDADRLACYDRTAAALETSITTKEVVLVEREEVRRTKRRLFGFALPEKSVFGDTGDPETTQITTKITSIQPSPSGLLIGVETGGTWLATEYSSYQPRKGDDITIAKGSLGGFFLSFKRGGAVRGKRVQ